MMSRLRHHIKDHIMATQDRISFMDESMKYVEVEVDEVTLGKLQRPDGKVEWIQFLGLIRRGHPESLVLEPLEKR
eukprot:6411408-Amphidinium_carterae.1